MDHKKNNSKFKVTAGGRVVEDYSDIYDYLNIKLHFMYFKYK